MSTTDTPRKPVKYIVLEKSLIGNELFEAGQTCEYDGLPAENLKPTCEVGEARYQEYLASNAERVARMRAAHSESAVGDPAAFAAAVAKAIVEANAGMDARITDAVAAALSKAKPAKASKAEETAPA